MSFFGIDYFHIFMRSAFDIAVVLILHFISAITPSDYRLPISSVLITRIPSPESLPNVFPSFTQTFSFFYVHFTRRLFPVILFRHK